MAPHVPSELARQYIADRLAHTDHARPGRRLAIELRAHRYARARARRVRLVIPVGAARR